MSDGCRKQLGWEVSADLWDRFERSVESEWGDTSPYTGIQIEQSWREYHADGGKHPLEEVSQKIVAATGRSQNDLQEKNPRTRIDANSETTTVWVRVHEDVKDEMAAFADESNVPKRSVLSAVLTWYLEGGRDDRVLEKLERVVDDIEAAFETLDGSGTSLNKTERRTRAIAAHLGDTFTEEELAEAINAETSGTDYFHKEYSQRVIEFMGVKRLQKDDDADIFLPPQKWETKKVCEIIRELGGDTEANTAPPFSKEDFAKAFNQVLSTRARNSPETVSKFLDRVLNRLFFAWNPATEQYESNPRVVTGPSTGNNSSSGASTDD